MHLRKVVLEMRSLKLLKPTLSDIRSGYKVVTPVHAYDQFINLAFKKYLDMEAFLIIQYFSLSALSTFIDTASCNRMK